jgi:hypothetical protein
MGCPPAAGGTWCIKIMSITVKQFLKGLVTRIEDKDAARGSASDMLNWHSLGDHIELRRGQVLLGTENTGSGSITGLKIARRHDDVEYPFFTTGRKAYYVDVAADTTTEIGTDLLPAAANNEDISIEQYKSLAGDFVYMGSPNFGLIKIPVANPGSVVDLLVREYRGKFKIKQSRQFLWDRKDTFGGSDQTGIYLSHIDATDEIYDFTSAEELGTGDGATTTFSGTLAFKAANAKETCFFIVVAGAKAAATSISAITQATAALVTSTAHGLSVGDSVVFAGVVGMTQINSRIGVVLTVPTADTFTVNIDSTNFTAYSSGGTVAKAERFIDNRSGTLTGQDGGTGTINYATGAYSVTFAAPVKNGAKVVTQYFREDSTKTTGSNPTLGGIANFAFSATRGLGEGNVFRQDDGGGKFMSVESFGDTEYCFHEFKTWALTLTQVDTAATNLIYRDNVGIPYHRAARATGDGIYYVDAIGENPAIRLLDYGRNNTSVVPRSVSDALDLNGYTFDTAVVFEWGDYICVAVNYRSSGNNRLLMRHKVWKSWEVHSFRCSIFDVLSGALIAGDSGSPNVFKLFSGLADEDSNIENYYITNNDPLDKEGVKVCNRIKVAGYIGVPQGLKVSYSLDYDPFVEITQPDGSSPIIKGDGPYVDLSQRKLIGSTTLGEDLIGGGQDPTNAIYASPYELEFHVGTAKFERIRLKFEATGGGYLSISEYGFVDVRDKGRRLPTKYVSAL